MKKLFASLLIIFAAVTLTAAEAYKFPGWKCTDEAKLNAALASANVWQKAPVLILQELAKTPAKDYAALCTIIDKAVDSVSELAGKDAAKVLYKKQFPYCRGEFIAEAWAFCQKNPTSYDFYYVAYKAKQLNLTDTQVYLRLRDYLLSYAPDAGTVRKGVDALLNAAVTVDCIADINVKEDLKKLNRKYSKNLLDDKAAWEPVVAKIRTTLETY